jgi:NAD(P)-dependent dehydrogenase (short-subunit alcohol dehydrogenase family)
VNQIGRVLRHAGFLFDRIFIDFGRLVARNSGSVRIATPRLSNRMKCKALRKGVVVRSLEGKVAVVTGGGSGIGMGIALALAREGTRVAVADIDVNAAEQVVDRVRSLGESAIATQVDVSSLQSVQELFAAVNEEFGTVHILCNNAGVSQRRRGIYATHEDWLWIVGVNLCGVIHGVETFLPTMLASGAECHIVNTASLNGIVPSGHSAMYSASKYGVMGLTETLHNELVGTNVGISALCPAAVATRIHESERNRPKELESATPAPPHVPSSTFDISPARSPEEVGSMVVAGIYSQQLYIFTDLKMQPIIESHFQRLLQDFAHLRESEMRPPT